MHGRETTKADEIARHGRLIEALSGPLPIRKLQHRLDEIGELWRSPDSHSCLRGGAHWHVPPDADAVLAVARHQADVRVDVRRSVQVALARCGHALEATPAVAAGLVDSDAVVRIQAARAAVELRLGETLCALLEPCLDDVVWTVRWHAAHALSFTRLRPRAMDAFVASRPAHHRMLDEWLAIARQLDSAFAIAR